MPTGYTAGIEDGTIKTFEEFLLECAKGFLIEYRDEVSLKEPIALARFPKSYHAEELQKQLNQAAEYAGFSEFDWRAEYDKFLKECESYNAKQQQEFDETKARYAAIQAKLNDWFPPAGFEELAKFMRKQIAVSIEHRDAPSLRSMKTFEEFKRSELEDVANDILHHLKYQKEDEGRYAQRNQWVAELYKLVANLNNGEGE